MLINIHQLFQKYSWKYKCTLVADITYQRALIQPAFQPTFLEPQRNLAIPTLFLETDRVVSDSHSKDVKCFLPNGNQFGPDQGPQTSSISSLQCSAPKGRVNEIKKIQTELGKTNSSFLLFSLLTITFILFLLFLLVQLITTKLQKCLLKCFIKKHNIYIYCT